MAESKRRYRLGSSPTIFTDPAGRRHCLGNDETDCPLPPGGEPRGENTASDYGQYGSLTSANTLLCNAGYFPLQCLPETYYALMGLCHDGYGFRRHNNWYILRSSNSTSQTEIKHCFKQ